MPTDGSIETQCGRRVFNRPHGVLFLSQKPGNEIAGPRRTLAIRTIAKGRTAFPTSTMVDRVVLSKTDDFLGMMRKLPLFMELHASGSPRSTERRDSSRRVA